MKKQYLIAYIIVAFIVSFSTLSITGALVTEYLMPSIDHLIPINPEKQLDFILDLSHGYFERALAFSFFILMLFLTPVITSYKFKTSLFLNTLATIVISSLFWLLLKAFYQNLLLSKSSGNYIVQLNPFYTKMSIAIGLITFLLVFISSLYFTSKKKNALKETK